MIVRMIARTLARVTLDQGSRVGDGRVPRHAGIGRPVARELARLRRPGLMANRQGLREPHPSRRDAAGAAPMWAMAVPSPATVVPQCGIPSVDIPAIRSQDIQQSLKAMVVFEVRLRGPYGP